ncbi:hypothetical protein HN695_04640 [Candidatus Woesearchaeota archaeon]|nr:hypothetical protein [Candidatus Woesearchaeota archaeon]MBT5271864.1 hypothetical protein [Candidatus Woesearchaeota archaeon]MBT6041672.1 hypothetical protein [Candidatus Woesearchaeota archaeon]MBT6337352.1 hypothetical protein [Candidatus Woesearchaeota archaeon]MBT7927600.1 hypothetical protein [Candidatus Woesearchaeota archaeon]
MENQTNMPEKKFSAGAISATIWSNNGQKDGKEYNFSSLSLGRCYKDKEGKWQNTNNLRVADLPKAVVVLSKAYEYLVLKENVQAQ